MFTYIQPPMIILDITIAMITLFFFIDSSISAILSLWPTTKADEWIQGSNGKWYFLLSNGVMAVNTWVESVYYVGSDGAMLTNKMTPDGYIVNSEGKWDCREPWVKRLQIALKDGTRLSGYAASRYFRSCRYR